MKSPSVLTLHIGQLSIEFYLTHLLHIIRCLHLRIMRFLQLLQQIMHACSSATFASYCFLLLCTPLNFKLKFQAASVCLISLTILVKIDLDLYRQNSAMIILNMQLYFSFCNHSAISFLLRPANRGTSLLPSTLHSNTKGLSVMSQLTRVSLPHVGPDITGQPLRLFINTLRKKVAIAAIVAKVYLNIVPKKPGLSLESKMLVQEYPVVCISLFTASSGINIPKGYSLSLTFLQLYLSIIQQQCCTRYFLNGIQLYSNILLPISNQLLSCLPGCFN